MPHPGVPALVPPALRCCHALRSTVLYRWPADPGMLDSAVRYRARERPRASPLVPLVEFGLRGEHRRGRAGSSLEAVECVANLALAPSEVQLTEHAVEMCGARIGTLYRSSRLTLPTRFGCTLCCSWLGDVNLFQCHLQPMGHDIRGDPATLIRNTMEVARLWTASDVRVQAMASVANTPLHANSQRCLANPDAGELALDEGLVEPAL